jgi:hypothetical protein
MTICDGGFDQGLADAQWDDDPRNPANEGIDEYCNDLYDEMKDRELEELG